MNIPSFKIWHDISMLLGETAAYPGDAPYSREVVSEITPDAPCSYSLSTLIMSAHAGTHLDAPAHFISGGKTLDQYPLERFLLPARVVSVEDDESIPPDFIRASDFGAGEALLFKTQNSLRGLPGRSAFSEKFVYLSVEAAQLCLDLGASLVGIDYLSVDRYGDDTAPAHRLLLKNDILILEGLDLKAVAPGEYFLLCLPLRVQSAEAAPARAVLARWGSSGCRG
jgi:arylformamidase